MHFISFPKIGQFNSTIQQIASEERYLGLDADGKPIYDGAKILPKVTFNGTEITHFPFQAPWMNWAGACLINIVGLRKNGDIIEAQVADEQGLPYRDDNKNYIWVNLKDFPNEWPK